MQNSSKQIYEVRFLYIGIASSSASVTTNSNPSVIQSTTPTTMPSAPNPTMPPPSNENVLVSVAPNNNEVSQPSLVQKQEAKSEFIGEPPPGLPPLGPDSLVITNNNGKK